MFNNLPVVQAQQNAGLVTNPSRNDRETNFQEKKPHRKQKEPDKYDREMVEWQDLQVHFETVAIWNGWMEIEKGLLLLVTVEKHKKYFVSLNPRKNQINIL